MRNQKGFTLIEIIAVLVILGILAAVAVPRFIDLQTEARAKAVQGALAAGASQLTMEYAQALLNGTATATSWTRASSSETLGDFTADLSGTCGANGAVIEVTGGPDWFTTADETTKSFTMCGS